MEGEDTRRPNRALTVADGAAIARALMDVYILSDALLEKLPREAQDDVRPKLKAALASMDRLLKTLETGKLP